MGVLDPWEKYPFVILDGGLASELEKKGCLLDDYIWSASVLVTGPSTVSDVHTAYLMAGADIITTASYQATIPGLVKYGCTAAGAAAVIAGSVKIAREAVSMFTGSEFHNPAMPAPLVAASAGSYGAFLADGSEYRGDYRLSEREYLDFHRERLEILIEAGADIIAFETVPSFDEARAIAGLMDEYDNMPYWISFTACDNRNISCGRPFADCVKMLSGRPSLVAAGINCSDPSFFSSLLESARPFSDKPFIVYPNSGEMYNAVDRHWFGRSRVEKLGAFAVEWAGLGARIIGGCCRTGPADTAVIFDARDAMMKRE